MQDMSHYKTLKNKCAQDKTPTHTFWQLETSSSLPEHSRNQDGDLDDGDSSVLTTVAKSRLLQGSFGSQQVA